jgi:NAD(P)-dependent dehydrogenase (short-subunit alcohol dehydrogenase family)
MLMKNIAHDYADKRICANAVLPGFVSGNAPEAEHSPDYQRHFPADRLPFGRGPGEEVARLAVFLAGPSASYISGQCVVVDGGFLVR